MTEDDLLEDVRYWKGRSDAAEAELADAKDDVLRLHKEKMDQYDRAIVAEVRLTKALEIIDGELKFYAEEHERKNLTDLGQHSFNVLRGIRERITRRIEAP